MAGDWIKWTKGLSRKREVLVLASKLHKDRHEIAARLMLLWEWCDENISEVDFDAEGNASLLVGDKPNSFIDDTVGLSGFAEAMASPEVCWLTVRSGGRITFPNLARHNGSTAKTRAYEQKKKRDQRHDLSRSDGDNSGTSGEREREERKAFDKRLSKEGPIPPLSLPRKEKKKAIRQNTEKVDWDRVVVDAKRIRKSIPAVSQTDAVQWCQVAALIQITFSESCVWGGVVKILPGHSIWTRPNHFFGVL
jgi:hypothetical protein